MILDKDIFEYAVSIGCCKTCCLRYVKGRGNEFSGVDESLKKRNLPFAGPKETEDEHLSPKKVKRGACVACMGILQEDFLADVSQKIADTPEMDSYRIDDIMTSISLPIILHLRRLSIWIAMINKFGEDLKDHYPDTPLKDVVKLLLNPKVCEATKKTFGQEGITVNLSFSYKNESEELEPLSLVKSKLKSPKPMKKSAGKEYLTRNGFEKYFIPSHLCLNTYAKHFQVPPQEPQVPIEIEEIKFVGPTVFIAGRYCKLSREISQTPWVLKGKKMMEESVLEIIVDNFAPSFGVSSKDITFSSSGREDCDVRCLGRGRPFVLEVSNCTKTILDPNEARTIETNIVKSEKIIVRDLQVVQRKELSILKKGEEMKKKTYQALCMLNRPVTEDILKKCDIPNEFTIDQKTPLRVLHRRSMIVRKKSIYNVKGFSCKDHPNMLVIRFETQAGTYIKELVHGEFGRTQPSILSIIGEWIDITLLDVIDIDLDWPPAIELPNSGDLVSEIAEKTMPVE